MTFASLLKQHRLGQGLSQQALAERAGLSVRGISDLERGVRRAPQPSTTGRLADALHLDTSARSALAAAAYSPTDPAPPLVAAADHRTVIQMLALAGDAYPDRINGRVVIILAACHSLTTWPCAGRRWKPRSMQAASKQSSVASPPTR